MEGLLLCTEQGPAYHELVQTAESPPGWVWTPEAGGRVAWASLVLPLPGSLNLGKIFRFSMLQFPTLEEEKEERLLKSSWQ